MIDRKELDKRIKTILGLCQTVNKLSNQYGSDQHKAADRSFWEAIQALDEEAASNRGIENLTVQPGRLVSFPIKDNYARYIVSRVGNKTCKLIHIPYSDAYQTIAVTDGEIFTGELEKLIGWEDRLTELFKVKLQARVKVNEACVSFRNIL